MAFGVQHGAGAAAQAVLSTAASPKAGGTIAPAGTTSYDGGTVVSVTATISAGYALDHWEVDGVNKGSANSISVTMGTGVAPVNHLVVAVIVVSSTASGIFGLGATPVGFAAATATTSISVTAAGDQSFTLTDLTTSNSVTTGGNVSVVLTGGKTTSSGTGVTTSFTTAGSGLYLPPEAISKSWVLES